MKFCTHCGNQLTGEEKFCKSCGKKIKGGESYTKSKYSPALPIYKLILLSVSTFGFYQIYWFGKQWDVLKRLNNAKVTPVLRALFSPLFAYSLFKNLFSFIREETDLKSFPSAGWLAIAYIALLLVWRSQGAWSYLGFLAFLPLIPVQNALNYYWEQKEPEKNPRKGLSFGEGVVIVIGGGIFSLALLGTLYPNNNSTVSNTNSNANASTVDANNTPTPLVAVDNNYNQDVVASSVVNIFCPSNVRGESTLGGSGTIITESGLVLTNSHIIPQDSSNIHVDKKGCLISIPDPQTGQPKEIYLATPIVIPDLSTKYDLAYMSIYAAYYDTDKQEYDGVFPKKFQAYIDTASCKNKKVQLGEPIRILGYPAISGGYNLTVTDGEVSSFPGDGLIVTSAKISHGNSGGLAVDKEGCMVGVPSMVSSDDSESLGVIYSMDLVHKFDSEVTAYLNTLK